MPRIALLVEYDGTNYHGFQWQPECPTIQQELEAALGRLTDCTSRVAGASRTDAGTHAKGQVVSFMTTADLPRNTWMQGLNHFLPSDIAVLDACRVDDDFDVRKRAQGRLYEYRVLNRTAPSPIRKRFTHHEPRPLDVEAMNEACSNLVGSHDFRAFTALTERCARRTVFAASVHREDDEVSLTMFGSSFLPQQVRNTAGGLLSVGLGKISVGDFAALAKSGKPGIVGPAAPAKGLCLISVAYPGNSPFVGERHDENV